MLIICVTWSQERITLETLIIYTLIDKYSESSSTESPKKTKTDSVITKEQTRHRVIRYYKNSKTWASKHVSKILCHYFCYFFWLLCFVKEFFLLRSQIPLCNVRLLMILQILCSFYVIQVSEPEKEKKITNSVFCLNMTVFVIGAGQKQIQVLNVYEILSRLQLL